MNLRNLVPHIIHLALALLSVTGAAPDDSKAIDDYIFNLDYDPEQVLAYHGVRVKGVPREGKVDDVNTFIVIERNKESLTTADADIGVIASNEHQTYPGNLLLANDRLMDNSPTVLAVDRDPLRYTVNLPGMKEDGSFVITPTFSEYMAARNQVLDTWFKKYPNDHNVVANFKTVQSMAYSKELLRVKFGLDFKHSDVEADLDFEAVNNQEKLIMVHMFKQIFYTVSVGATERPSDLFASNVDLKQVQDKTDARNPPVIVDSVSYGRTIYVKLETSSTDNDAKFVLENKITAFDISNDDEVEYQKILKDLAITVYVLGGSSGNIDLINAQRLKDVNDVIVSRGQFGQDNLGFPVSYSTQFIKDNTRAVVNCYTQYIEITRMLYPSGIVKIIHHGWYVSKWQISWTEISYDLAGKRIETEKKWDKNGHHLYAPFTEEIEMPGNTVDIHVQTEELTGWVLLDQEPWREIIDRSGIPLIGKREFHVGGTTMFPTIRITPPLETTFQTTRHFL